MRATLVVVLIALCMVPPLQAMSPQTTFENISIEIDTFGNGKKSVTADFPGPGTDESIGLSVQTGLYIDEASMKVSTVAQPPGSTDYPTNLTVNFGGDTSVEWAFRGPGYNQFGRQTLFVNNYPVMNGTIPFGGGSNNSVAIRLPKTAQVRSASMNISTGLKLGTPGKILVLNAASNYYGFDTDAYNKLKTFTSDFKTVDKFDAYSNTPTWDDLKDYSAILTYTDWIYGYTYKDATTVGNLLADYVDAGGSLVSVFATMYNYYKIGGRYDTAGYYVMKPGTMLSSSGVNVGTINIPDHPVMTNVTTVKWNPSYNYAYHSTDKTMSTGSSVIAYWSDGSIMAAQNTINGVDRVDLNVWPISSDASGMYGSYPYYNYQSGSDVDDLMKNALLFCGRKPISLAVDLLNDTTQEFNVTDFMGNYTFPDFSSSLNNYLASAEVSFTDRYGNQFVDVPINVSSFKAGTARFDNLEVIYDYTTGIKDNPSTGDLATSLADLQQATIGTQNYTIPMVLYSDSAGRAKFSDLYLKMSPPVHKPTINSIYPAANTVIKENTQLDFGIDVVDWYGNPMTTMWSFNGADVPDSNKSTFSNLFDYETAGNHTVKVSVANGLSKAEQVWTVMVLNVNRPPALVDFSPLADPNIDENQTAEFRIGAADPDKEILAYKWTLDGKAQPAATGNSFLFSTGFSSAGDHTVKALASDPGGLSTGKNWTVHVNNVNVPPAIAGFAPKTNPRIQEKESWQFSVTPSDPDGQTLTTTWFVDDVQVFVGNPYIYTSDYKSAGVHKIRATVSDGKETASHTWDLTVVNVNRAPTAVIDSPTAAEFKQGASIHFSGKSSSDPDNEALAYSWKEGGVNVSDQAEFDRVFPPGLHTITLEAKDTSGAVSTSQVRFRVRFVEISVLIGLDRLEMAAGDKVDIIITMSNVGDDNATDLSMDVLVDGKSIGTKTYADIAAGGGTKELFKWKAVKGEHTITVKMGEQTWTKSLTVQKAPDVAAANVLATYALPLMIVIVAVALVGFGAVALRRK